MTHYPSSFILCRQNSTKVEIKEAKATFWNSTVHEFGGGGGGPSWMVQNDANSGSITRSSSSYDNNDDDDDTK
jgi:hypothetical protein